MAKKDTINNGTNDNAENEGLSAEELQQLEDDILLETAGGTDNFISPNIGCIDGV